jgi:hypothetical protein
MKTAQIIFTAALTVFMAVLLTLRISNTSWEQKAIDNEVGRYHPNSGKFEWTNVKLIPQWESIKNYVELLDEQRKNSGFRQTPPKIMPNQQPPRKQNYQANSK